MSNDVELLLRDLLLFDKETQKTTQKIIERLKNPKISQDERHAFLCFLIHAGDFLTALEFFFEHFKNKKTTSFRSFLYLLFKAGFKPGKEFLNALDQYLKVNSDSLDFKSFSPWENQSSSLLRMRQIAYRQMAEEQENIRRQNFDKLDFLRDQRLIEEEGRRLRDLLQQYPDDENLAIRYKDYQERWARSVVGEKVKSLYLNESELIKDSPLSPEETAWAEYLLEQIEDLITQQPHQAYNLSYLFYFIELYEEALLVLDRAEPHSSTLWLRLDLLLKAKRYIDCLDHIFYVEHALSHDPETTFAATYLRAQVLNGLGQTGPAIELLKSIVSIRPSYRAAHSLLLEWGQGGSSV